MIAALHEGLRGLLLTLAEGFGVSVCVFAGSLIVHAIIEAAFSSKEEDK